MTHATHSFDALMDITARPQVVFVRGKGGYLWDDSGKRYLDFMQGWAVNCLGHSPDVIADALAAQSAIPADAEPGLLQRPEPQARQGACRAELLRPGVLRQFRRGSQRRRDQARAQIRLAAQGRRARDHHLRRRLSWPHARDHVGLRQEGVRAAVRAQGVGLPKGKAERSRLGEGADHAKHRCCHAGADPGRSRRVARHATNSCRSCAR